MSIVTKGGDGGEDRARRRRAGFERVAAGRSVRRGRRADQPDWFSPGQSARTPRRGSCSRTSSASCSPSAASWRRPPPRADKAPAVAAAMVERLTAEVRRIEAIDGVLGRLGDSGRARCVRRARRRAGGVPPGGTAGGAARRIGRGSPRRLAGVSQPPLRPAVDSRPADRKPRRGSTRRCGLRRQAARNGRARGEPMSRDREGRRRTRPGGWRPRRPYRGNRKLSPVPTKQIVGRTPEPAADGDIQLEDVGQQKRQPAVHGRAACDRAGDLPVAEELEETSPRRSVRPTPSASEYTMNASRSGRSADDSHAAPAL